MEKMILALGLALTFGLAAHAAEYPQDIARKIASAQMKMTCERKIPTVFIMKMFAGKSANDSWITTIMGRNNKELMITSISNISNNADRMQVNFWILTSDRWVRVDELTGNDRLILNRNDLVVSDEEIQWIERCALNQSRK